jgi:hypothetical protein
MQYKGRGNGRGKWSAFELNDVEFLARSELEYHLLLAKALELIKHLEYNELTQRTTEVKRMLTALLQKVSVDR